MITKELAEASTEINDILKYLPTEYVEKIPIKLRNFFKEVKSEEYISKVDPYKPIDEQELLPKTELLLTIIYRNYWCNEEEKIKLDEILIENDSKYEEELRKKYNYDNMFKKKENEIKKDEIVVYDNKTWYQKMAENIRNIFKKLFGK